VTSRKPSAGRVDDPYRHTIDCDRWSSPARAVGGPPPAGGGAMLPPESFENTGIPHGKLGVARRLYCGAETEEV